jgi:outer membrane receptor protein involved in Fe transport
MSVPTRQVAAYLIAGLPISVQGLRGMLLAGTALGAAAQPLAAVAQTDSGNPKTVEEVVVTATRQISSVNKVALSVSAVTQKSLDQQGIRSVQDLSNQVPGLTYRVSGFDGNPQLTVRGIGGNAIASGFGFAATTGVYIDDITLQKRNVNSLETGSGSPLPLLYDLDRIEVLRGPQGTLYGGSSEGGTLRFITPQPSLTTYSGSARLGWSAMQNGGMGYEAGAALGGPIVQDKLGFRLAGFTQGRPGWIGLYSEWDGHQFASNVNWGADYSLRAALLWQVTPSFKATLSVLNQMNYDNDPSLVGTNSPAIKIPVKTFANCAFVLPKGTTPAQAAAALSAAGHAGCGAVTPTGAAIIPGLGATSNGVSFSFPATVFGGYTVPAVTSLGNRNGIPQGLYLTPDNPIYLASPRRTLFTLPSLTLDYTWNDKIDFKSITAYVTDRTSGSTFHGSDAIRPSVLPFFGGQPCPSGPGLATPILAAANTCVVQAPFMQLPPYPNGPMYPGQLGSQVPGPANEFGNYLFNNRRGQTTQEFRVSTVDPSWRLQVVAGMFILANNNHVNNGSNWNEDLITRLLRGSSESYYAGGSAPAPLQQTPGNIMVDVSTRNIDISENEYSAFADITFAVTSQFKINAGVRGAYYQQHFTQIFGGVISGPPQVLNGSQQQFFQGSSSTGQTVTILGQTSPLETNPNSMTLFPTNYAACPRSIHEGATNPVPYLTAGCPYQYTDVTFAERPVTPKVGASYQLTPGDLLYVTYAEGERPGGVNPPVPAVQCAADLANLGVSQAPATYQHDTVKSTEVGGKFHLFDGQAQINVSAFHIEWDNVQFVLTLPMCGAPFIANAARADSDGGEVQATGRWGPFTINGNLGYDDARYASTVRNSAGQILANKGDNLGVPDWTANLGVQYDARIAQVPVYVRADYSYTGKYIRTTGPGSASFNPTITPNFINGDETHIVNARAGFYWKALEVAAYVKNAGNSLEWINKTQGFGTYFFMGNTVIPRTVGIQLNYRF